MCCAAPPSKVPVNRLGPRLRCCCCAKCVDCDVGAASLAQLGLRDCAASCSVCLALATVFILILAAVVAALVVVFSFYLFIIWSQTPLTHICGQLLQTSCCAATAGSEQRGEGGGKLRCLCLSTLAASLGSCVFLILI